MGWVVAAVLAAAAVVVRVLFQPVLGTDVYFMTAFPAVIVATLYAGIGPGVFCCLLCIIGLYSTVKLPGTDGQWYDIHIAAPVMAALATALLMVVICARYRRSRESLMIARQRERGFDSRLRTMKSDLKTTSAQVEAMLSVVPVPILIAMDANAKFVTGNQAMYEMLELDQGCNLSPAAVPVQRAALRFHRDGVEIPAGALPLQLALSGQSVRGATMDIVFTDGRVKRLRGDAQPLWNAQGRVCGAVAAFVDLGDRGTEVVAAPPMA